MDRSIPIDFILNKKKPTWRQVSLGVEEGWLEFNSVIKFAEILVSEGDYRTEVLDIASITDTSSSIANELFILSKNEQENNQEERMYWLRIILAWIYENKEKFDDPLGIVEGLYADFDYPDEIRNLVRYNEAEAGYRPQDFSSQENTERLLGLWKKYIDNQYN